jgi:hypothetical protein
MIAVFLPRSRASIAARSPEPPADHYHVVGVTLDDVVGH